MTQSFIELDKSSQDVAAEGAILSEMLEIVAKRAALRPSECQNSSDSPTTSSSPPVSLPMLPPQTTHNPLHFTANKIYKSTPAAVVPRSHRTKPQLSAKEQDVSAHFHFNDDTSSDFCLRTNLSLMHDYNELLRQYEAQFIIQSPSSQSSIRVWKVSHLIMVIFQFIVLFTGVLYYAHRQVEQ